MKTLRHQAQPEKAKMEPEPKRKAEAPESFTASELDAAEQLIHLSESSTSTGNPTAGRALTVASAASGSSSPRSVNAPPAPGTMALALPRAVEGRVDEEEENEQEVAGSQRRTKRYRPIAEIYRATERIRGCSLKP